MNICMPVLRILCPINFFFFFLTPGRKRKAFGVLFCLLYKLALQTSSSATASTSEPSARAKQIFAVNPALVSGVRKIISFTVRLNIFSPAKLSVNLSATEITEEMRICLVAASAKSLSLVYAGKIS